MATFRISGRTYALERRDVEAAVAGELPEPLHKHYVVVSGRRFPPKQVLTKATGLDRGDFHTHHARSILRRLGFVAARVGASSEDAPSTEAGNGPQQGRQASALAPYVGKWVALAGPTEVLVAADRPQEILAWLSTHERRAPYGMFKVPEIAREAQGAAPL